MTTKSSIAALSGATQNKLVGEIWDHSAPKGTLLFLHGGCQQRLSWAKSADAFHAQGYRCIAYDQRGHGDSDWSIDGIYNLDLYVADLRAVIGALALDEPPILIGASLGGIVSLLFAAADSASARAIVLADVVARLEPSAMAEVSDFMHETLNGFTSLEDAARQIAIFQGRVEPTKPEKLRPNLRQSEDGRWRWHWDPNVIRPRDRIAESARMTAAAKCLHIPTLLLRGEHSRHVTPEGAADFLRLAPHAKFAEIPGVGHMLAGDDNSPFGIAVLQFLKDLRPG